MPYVAAKTRDYLDKNIDEAKTDGEVTYVFYRYFLTMWNTEPRWTTYATIRKLCKNFHLRTDFEKIVTALFKRGVEALTIQVAAETAADELKRQKVDAYEDSKIKEHGVIE